MSRQLTKLLIASLLYAAFAVYLYQPPHAVIVAGAVFSALGCFILSRRWVGAFAASLIAGAIYGFGPYSLWLAGYHCSVVALAAAVPWLFLPAARVPLLGKWRLLSWPLSVLPFAAIILFFEITTRCRLFALPIQTRLNLSDLTSLFAPLIAARQHSIVIGFYHVPLACLLMGAMMLVAARRFAVFLIFAIGTLPAFLPPVGNTSPIIWLTIPTLCCSIIIGAGFQGLVQAGYADRKWLLAVSAVMAILATATVFAASRQLGNLAGLFAPPCYGGALRSDESSGPLILTSQMYILSAVVTSVIAFIACLKLRLVRLRRGASPRRVGLRIAVLFVAIVIDIFFSSAGVRLGNP